MVSSLAGCGGVGEDVIEGGAAQPVTRRTPIVKMAINTSGTLFIIRHPLLVLQYQSKCFFMSV
jgi:hypothetical protein